MQPLGKLHMWKICPIRTLFLCQVTVGQESVEDSFVGPGGKEVLPICCVGDEVEGVFSCGLWDTIRYLGSLEHSFYSV